MSATDQKINGSDEQIELYNTTVPSSTGVLSRNAKIQNPLHGKTKESLFADVTAFCHEYGFVDQLETFKKGALLAQDSSKLEHYSELSEEDKEVIRAEKAHKWRQPKALIYTVVMASIGAAVHGWDQTGSNGANLSFPIEFDINDATGASDAARNQWLVGLVNAAPYIAIAFIGCWLSDPLNSMIGRRGVTFVAGVICLITPIGSALTSNWVQLFIVRLILGMGMGLKASTVPIWNAENVPASIRGGLVMSWQMWDAFGIFLGFCANLAVFQVGKLAWRLQLGSACIPALVLVIGIPFCPESPRWLIKKGRYPQAYRSFLRLRNSPLQAARDMYYVHRQLEEEHFAMSGSNVITRFTGLFTIPRIRRATLGTFVVMLAQQMCGINIIAFYSSSVFSQAGYSNEAALLASFGFGFLNFLCALPAVFTIDTFGRRNLLLTTFPLMCLTLLGSGLCFLIQVDSPARIPLIAVFIYLFCAVYSVGEGPVPFAYGAEVFPLTHREVGMGFGVATCFFWAAVLSLTWPRLVGALGSTGAFGFYAGLNLVALVMIFYLVPETKQLTLEELDHVFEVRTMDHCRYQANVWLPWFIKSKIFRQKVDLPSLYNFDEVADHVAPETARGSRAV